MKKYLVAGLLAVTLMVGFAKKADAVQQEISCYTIHVYCGPEKGYAGYGLLCFETGNAEEMEKEYDALTEAVCS